MAAPRSSRRRRFDDADWRPAHEPTVDTNPFHPARTRGDVIDHDVIDHDVIDHDTSDHDTNDHDAIDHDAVGHEVDDVGDEPSWSTYREATKGPTPLPDWIVTDPRAIDTDHGVLKSGKEADVALVTRAVADDLDGVRGARRTVMAAKRYRGAQHRMFHRDAGYLEGRRVRRSRDTRAMASRSAYGRELLSGQWAAAEFAVLSRLWQAGAAVPYPVQVLGTELMMEFIGTPDGVAAPRLAQTRPDRELGRELYRQLFDVLRDLADAGYTHADLSPYNVLVHEERLVLIDLPQAVDLVGNPQGFEFLRRDCTNICSWFVAHGVGHADATDLYERLLRSVPGLDRYA